MSTTQATPELVRLSIDTIKMLAVDAVEKANSGHPGTPMGAADYAFLLWTRFLRHDPADPAWPGRDRFVLSAGHASMLLYALVHLSGYDLSLEEIRRFRQWGSRTPGHPEYGETPGVEVTTGPLGQGVGNGVGMALAAKMLAARFNTEEFAPVTHRVWGIVSDGDLMEGVASEACSLAGHLGLGNLCFLYDDNHITIEGDTKLAFSEEVGKRFEAYRWNVIRIDGHDHAAILGAFEAAKAETARPTLVIARTHIANGAPNAHDTAEAHGAPLGRDEVLATKRNLGFPGEPAFHVPDEVRALFAARAKELRAEHLDWDRRFEAWRTAHPDLAVLWRRMHAREVPPDLFERLRADLPAKPAATRALGGAILQRAAALVPALVGGSADLDPSTKTRIQAAPSVAPGEFGGRTFHFGIREHAMGAIVNGLVLHGGFLAYGSTFLIFSDYMRPPIRLAALMGIPSIFVFTHDSVFLGEDGPTHQPVETLPALRAVPNLVVVRPADGLETAAAWTLALTNRTGPTCLALTRQALPVLPRDPDFDPALVLRGGYVLAREAKGPPDLVIVATGSEVAPCLDAKARLEMEGRSVRVVSLPALEVFLAQDEAYRAGVIPVPEEKLVIVEAARPVGWDRIAGPRAFRIGIERFGASAPDRVLAERFGFTGEQIAEQIRARRRISA